MAPLRKNIPKSITVLDTGCALKLASTSQDNVCVPNKGKKAYEPKTVPVVVVVILPELVVILPAAQALVIVVLE